MDWHFTKMHGAGNDFVVLDGVRQTLDLTPERVRRIAHRQWGVGADQVLVVEPALRADADFRYRVFNADGSEVEHCGNGARCFVRFVREKGLTDRNPVRAEICTGIIVLTEQSNGEVTVEMGRSSFEPLAVPFDAAGLTPRHVGQDQLWPLDLGTARPDQPLWVSVLAISNPHAVCVVDDLDATPVSVLGPRVEKHARFPRRVNAGFMQVLDRHTITLRVYERGAGETLACGTGACAAAAAGIRRGLLDSPVKVHTRGGVLTIAWDGEQLSLTGPAETVFDGVLNIERLMSSSSADQ